MTNTQCPVCGDGFTSDQGVRDHAWDVHSACHHCEDRFDDREALFSHWLEAHGDELSGEARKRAETKVGDRTVCPVCSERFASVRAVSEHAWDAHEACGYCGERLAEQEELYVHWLAVHETDLIRAERTQAQKNVGTLSFGDRYAHQGLGEAISGLRISRRALLGGGTAGFVALASGFLLSGVFGDSKERQDDNPSLEGHPAAVGLGSQPILGPTPTEADGTIIAFEDPSCPSCARFELGTFPELKSRLIDTGRVAFVYRGIPVVQPWGDPAVLALEATYARDKAAFWALKRFYYHNQRAIGGENVRSETRRFLSDRTDVDAAAVLSDVDEATYRDAVNDDLNASRNAGVRGTPTFFLFNEGGFVTDIVGTQPYQVFKNSLGV